MKRWFELEWTDDFGEQWMNADNLNLALRQASVDKGCKVTRAMDFDIDECGKIRGVTPCDHRMPFVADGCAHCLDKHLEEEP